MRPTATSPILSPPTITTPTHHRPADYAGDFEKNFIGTGPFKLEKYTPKVGASFTRFDGYWGRRRCRTATEWIFDQDLQAGVLALQGNLVDVITQVPVQGGQALLNDPNIRIISERTSAHQQVHMRSHTAPRTMPGSGAPSRSASIGRRW